MEKRPFFDPQLDGRVAIDAWGEVMRHVIDKKIIEKLQKDLITNKQ